MKNRILLNRSHESCRYLSFLNSGLEHSEILAYNGHYLRTLGIWLKPVLQSKSSYWKRCWQASDDGWASTTFHSKCDDKGPTVTIIRVGKYIFGGYTSTSWGKWINKCLCFIFLFSETCVHFFAFETTRSYLFSRTDVSDLKSVLQNNFNLKKILAKSFCCLIIWL